MNEAILNVVLWSDRTEPQAPSDLREADNFDTHIFSLKASSHPIAKVVIQSLTFHKIKNQGATTLACCKCYNPEFRRMCRLKDMAQ